MQPCAEVWVFHLSTLCWKELKLKGAPSARHSHAAAFDPKSFGLFVFGGQSAEGEVLKDCHVLRSSESVPCSEVQGLGASRVSRVG